LGIQSFLVDGYKPGHWIQACSMYIVLHQALLQVN
jgi:hypothetical protein